MERRAEVQLKGRFLMKRVEPASDSSSVVGVGVGATGVGREEVEAMGRAVGRGGGGPEKRPAGAFSRYRTLPPTFLYTSPRQAFEAETESLISTMAIVPDGGRRSREMVPKGEKRAVRVAEEVLYGKFLTSTVVLDRGPGVVRTTRLTPSCNPISHQ